MRPAPVPLVDQVYSARSAVCCATRRISATAAFASALAFFWVVVGIGTASSTPCPPGTVPAPPPLSGCLVLAPCPAGETLQNGTCPAQLVTCADGFDLSAIPDAGRERQLRVLAWWRAGRERLLSRSEHLFARGDVLPVRRRDGHRNLLPARSDSDVGRHLRSVQRDNCQDYSERWSLSAVGGAAARRHLP